MYESTSSSLKRLQDLSEAEIEALADAVEAGKPLDYPYFRWTQHLRRYVLFYWALGLTPTMLWSANNMQDSASGAVISTLLMPVVCWFLSPRLADASPDVKESVRDVVRRLHQSVKQTSSRWSWCRCMIVNFGFYGLLLLCCIAYAQSNVWFMCGMIILWFMLHHRYSAVGTIVQHALYLKENIASYALDIGKEANPIHHILYWVFGFFLFIIVALLIRDLPNLEGGDRLPLRTLPFSSLFLFIPLVNVVVYHVPWGSDTMLLLSCIVSIVIWSSAKITNFTYQKMKNYAIYKEITTII
ncbi:MAG: hypothetical protein EAZ74_05840 [Alphaproteobacteria bacterium]|nr:MAG: hypothetical protein EAZ74_05840 [Alphaproteobacteria bacterium]TAF75132.1 MAG: hypothetical protein EAZ52_07535 [Alphaproteobacteria bacterium]